MRPTGTDEPGIIALEDPQALRWQERMWRFQRGGWAVTLLIVVAAVLGLLGPGLFFVGEARSDDGRLVIDYGRVVHNGGEADLQITYEATSSPVTLTLTRPFASSLSISNITPEPSSFRAGSDTVELEFEPLEDQPLKVTIEAKGDDIGLVRGQLLGSEGQRIGLIRFLWP